MVESECDSIVVECDNMVVVLECDSKAVECDNMEVVLECDNMVSNVVELVCDGFLYDTDGIFTDRPVHDSATQCASHLAW